MAKSTNPAADTLIAVQLKSIAEQLDEIVRLETGRELGIILLVQPWGTADDTSPREMHYISTMPKEHVQNALAELLKHWNSGVTHR